MNIDSVSYILGCASTVIMAFVWALILAVWRKLRMRGFAKPDTIHPGTFLVMDGIEYRLCDSNKEAHGGILYVTPNEAAL